MTVLFDSQHFEMPGDHRSALRSTRFTTYGPPASLVASPSRAPQRAAFPPSVRALREFVSAPSAFVRLRPDKLRFTEAPEAVAELGSLRGRAPL